MPSRARLLAPAFALVLVATSAGAAFAADPPARPPSSGGRAWDRAAVTDTTRLVVALRSAATSAAIGRLEAHGAPRDSIEPGARRAVVRVPTEGLDATRDRLLADPAVASVAVSGRLYRDADPTDETYWDYLWGLHNTGQPVFDTTGTADIDIDGLQALGVADGTGVVVAVIDDGVDFSHPDLAGRAWTNPGEVGDDGVDNGLDRHNNGIDDDGNGYPDDVHGWDFCHDEPTVHDPGEDFHGTHVAGTIAASLDGSGIVGVAPGVRIMALKFLGDGKDAFGTPLCGWDDQAAAAIAYAKSFGVRISNNSWGRPASDDPADDQLLYDAIAGSGMLFVASAGNAARNNDTSPDRSIPASFNLSNILSVAAIDSRGALAGFSNYGPTTVDIAAPGVDIVSTVPAYDPPGASPGWAARYVALNGTSMAAPHVTGVAALIGAGSAGLLASPTSLKARILATGKARPGTSGRTLTGRIGDAMFGIDTTPPVGQAPKSYAFVNGTILGSSIATRVRWPSGTDGLSGVGSYALRQSVNGAAWTTVTAGTTALFVDRSLAINTAYRYRVRPQDRAGNAGAYVDGPLVKPTLTQGTSSSLTWTGTWTTARSSSASGGSTRYATRAGAAVSYTFSGRAIAVVSPRSASRGSVKVYVDGTLVSTVSTYRSSSQNRVVIFGRNWGSVGTHTIKLVVVGTAGHPRFDLDAFAVLK